MSHSPEWNDYPAAHSIDSTWFAVDGKGQVAAFITGENGHVPQAYEWNEQVESYFLQLNNQIIESPKHVYWNESLQNLGLFVYDYESYEIILDPYERMEVPAVPIHVNQLPPVLRREVGRIRLPQVDFLTTEWFQPLEENLPCETWGDYGAFFRADRRTISPIPDSESLFVASITDFVSDMQVKPGEYVLSAEARALLAAHAPLILEAWDNSGEGREDSE